MDMLRKQSRAVALLVMLVAFSLLLSLLFTETVPARSSPSAGSAAQKQIKTQLSALPAVGTFSYGKSGLGTSLTCVRILPQGQVKASILLTFEIHGFEDDYPRDGQILVDIGNAAAAAAAKDRAALGHTALYLVASANPDGLAEGTTANGKGRCQISRGVDINRDFPEGFRTLTDARNYTEATPLSVPESAGLADLVKTLKPAAVVDVHGWEDHLVGDPSVTALFANATVSHRQRAFDANCDGFFSLWASTQGAKAALLELPKNAAASPDDYAARIESDIYALAKLVGG